jgi:hypothetical protein
VHPVITTRDKHHPQDYRNANGKQRSFHFVDGIMAGSSAIRQSKT